MNIGDSIGAIGLAGVFVLLAAGVVYRAWRGPGGAGGGDGEGPDYGPVALLFALPIWVLTAGVLWNYVYYILARALGQPTDFIITAGFAVLCAGAMWVAILERAARRRVVERRMWAAAWVNVIGLSVCFIALSASRVIGGPQAGGGAANAAALLGAGAALASWLGAALYASANWDETPMPQSDEEAYTPRPRCGRCGYDFTGLPASQMHCPECGAERDPGAESLLAAQG